MSVPTKTIVPMRQLGAPTRLPPPSTSHQHARPLPTTPPVAVSVDLGTPSHRADPPVPTAEVVGSTRAAVPLDTSFRWARDDYSTTRRTIDVWLFFLTLRTRLSLLDAKWSYPGGFTAARKSARQRSLAVFTRESILQLGPTFIKIGQLFSTRSDILGAEFVEELSLLQDRVPAFAAATAEAIVRRELGGPVDGPGGVFRSFNRTPIAAASLGQVHLAELHSGETVVVKVQRPGLQKLFDIDLKNLKRIAQLLDDADDAADSDNMGIYEECAAVLYDEIDYINEGRNADRFRRNFRDNPSVRVPTVYWGTTTARVITLEYLPGVRVTDVDALRELGLNAGAIARQATESYLDQTLRHGFFHADAHPGNISVDAQGRLLYYDFGMMGEIVPNVKAELLNTFYAIYKKDVDGVLSALLALQVIKATSSDTTSVRRAVRYFLDNLARQTEEGAAVAAIGEDLFAIAVDQPFRFPAAFTFVLRSFSSLEGIGKSLDPEYQFSAVAQPYGEELLNLRDSGAQRQALLAELQQRASQFAESSSAMPERVAKIEVALQQLQDGDFKPRVRVLEGERAARRQSLMQTATINAIAGVGFLNLAAELEIGGLRTPALIALCVTAGFTLGVARKLQRVRNLVKFEKKLS